MGGPSPEADFVRAMRDAPEEDAPRLVYADWLDEHGQPERAELIRVQCELARWVPDWQRRQHLEARQWELLAAFEQAWAGHLRVARDLRYVRRGFLSIRVSHRRLTGLRRPFPAHGWVQGVRLTNPEAVQNDAGPPPRPPYDLAAEYDLSNLGLDDEAAVRIARWPALAGVRALNVANNGLTAVGVRRLLDAPFMQTLRRLDVHGNPAAESPPDHPAVADPPGRLTNSVGMRFAAIPAGAFLMGSPMDEAGRWEDEGPRHVVTLTRPFWLGVYPVTREQYTRVTNKAKGDGDSSGEERLNPVNNVGWADATAFCRQLSALPAEKRAGRAYRLPTEAEWEHACRAGTSTPFASGGAFSSAYANILSYSTCGGAAAGGEHSSTTEVGFFEPNGFGLYDVHGNVWEWCADWYAAAYPDGPRTDPAGPPGPAKRRVLRGGAWSYETRYCRSACRHYNLDTQRNAHVGFRVALDLTAPDEPPPRPGRSRREPARLPAATSSRRG